MVAENLARYAANRLERGNVAAQNRRQNLVNDEPPPRSSANSRAPWENSQTIRATPGDGRWDFTRLRSSKLIAAALDHHEIVLTMRRRRIVGSRTAVWRFFKRHDETAANTKMVRLSGRCPRGERLIGRVPHCEQEKGARSFPTSSSPLGKIGLKRIGQKPFRNPVARGREPFTCS